MLPEYDPDSPNIKDLTRLNGEGYCLPAMTQFFGLKMEVENIYPGKECQKIIGEEMGVTRDGAGPGKLVNFLRRRGKDTCEIRNAKLADLVDVLNISAGKYVLICVWDDRLLPKEKPKGACRPDTHFMGALWTGEKIVQSSRTNLTEPLCKLKRPPMDEFPPTKKRVFDLLELSNGLSGVWRYTEEAFVEFWKSNRRVRKPIDGPWLMVLGVSGKDLNNDLLKYRKSKRVGVSG